MLPTTPKRRVPLFYTGVACVALLYLLSADLPFDIEVFAADVGDDSYGSSAPANVPAAAANEFPGSSDGFVRSLNEKGEEVYTMDCGNATAGMSKMCGEAEYEGQTGQGCVVTNTCYNNQVYVIPANDYYAWHAQYYCATCHMTSTILHALLFAHLFSIMSYPRTHFYTSVHTSYHYSSTPYYQSSAYSSRYGSPNVVNGRVVHTPTAAAAAGRGPTGPVRGTPVAQARPVATGTPLNRGGTPTAVGRPVSSSSSWNPFNRGSASSPTTAPTSRPTSSSPTTAPTSRPTSTSSRWSTVRRSYGGSSRFSSRGCFAKGALVTRPDGSNSPIETVRVGETIAAWPSAAAALAGELPRSIRVASLQRLHVPGPIFGVELVLPSGAAESWPPFATLNHALLAADGKWRAVDHVAAQNELNEWRPPASANGSFLAEQRPTIAPLATGAALLVAPPTLSTVGGRGHARLTNVTARAEAATLAKTVQADGELDVFSLELDVPTFGTYIVNGLLVID